MKPAKWHGQHGPVLLGPTEDRVARFLAWATDHGLVTLRTRDLAERLRLERSEAYRILRRLRILGLFGISDDRGGHGGGRRIWRTATRRATPVGLDPARHRAAWARITAYTRARRAALHGRLADRDGEAPTHAPAPLPPGAGAPTFADLFRAHGGGALLDRWGVT